MQRLVIRAVVLGTLALPPVGPAAAHAQVALAARASTLGLGAELSFRAGRNLGIRLGGNYLEFTRDETIKDIDYHATPHFENGTVILDLHPFGGSFHLSGGFLLNYNEGELVATLAHDIVIGGTTYTPQEVGSLTGTVTFRKTAPYLGLGFAGRSRIALLFDLGVGFTGKPQVELVGATNLTGPAKQEFDNNVEQERTEVQAEINKHRYLRYHPVVSFGIKFAF
jgi:outer membrane receptor protein involved in Fe transport